MDGANNNWADTEDDVIVANLSDSNKDEPQPKKPKGRPPKQKDDLNPDVKKLLKSKDAEIEFLKKDTADLRAVIENLRDANQDSHAELVKMRGSNDNLNRQLESKQDQIQLLHDDNDAKDREIANLTERLKQKQRDYEDILEQLDTSDNNLSMQSKKLSAVIIADEITAALANFLPDNFDWTLKRLSLKDLTADLLQPFDLVLFASGSVDLLRNTSWSELLSLAKKSADTALSAACFPVFLCLPPATRRPLSGKISLYNHRLSKIESLVLSPEIENYNKKTFLVDDIELSPSGAKLYMELIKDKLSSITEGDILKALPKTEARPMTTTDTNDDIKLVVDIPKDKLGRVIGKGGQNIRSVTSNHKVAISVGYWCEKDRGKEELRTIFSGLLIDGATNNTKNAKSQILSFLSDNSANN